MMMMSGTGWNLPSKFVCRSRPSNVQSSGERKRLFFELTRFYAAVNKMNRLLFRNLNPLYSWILAIAWCAISNYAAIVLLLSKSVTTDVIAKMIVVLFLLIEPFIFLKFTQIPIVYIWEEGCDNWLIVRRWLWKVQKEHVNPQFLPMPEIEEEGDNEGGKIYRCLLRTSAGRVEFGSYRRRERAEVVCDKMRNILSRRL